MSSAPLYAIVPAGGAGTRLWPLSRQQRPKFLLDVDHSGRSLLQRTWDRLSAVTDADRIVVVTGEKHQAAVKDQLPQLAAGRLLAEPSPRDSMPAIGWAAAVIEHENPDAVIASFAADHIIDDDDAFAAVVREAQAVAEAGYICTIGIEPTSPSSAFGYIETKDDLAVDEAPSARLVARFTEKPDEKTAAKFVKSGHFVWNAGMFVAKASVLLDHLSTFHPDLAHGVRACAAKPGSLQALWPHLTKIAIDHAVAEPVSELGAMAMVPARFDWEDIGDFAALSELDGAGANTDVVAIDAHPFVSSTTGTPVTVVGIEDAVVVDTGDAILVTTTAHAQQVKDAVAAWKERGRDDLV